MQTAYICVNQLTGQIVKRYFSPDPYPEDDPNILHIRVPAFYNALVVTYDTATNTFSDGVPEELRLHDAWHYLRSTRNTLLSNTDWTQLADIPAEMRAVWVVYRQALRDLPSLVTNPLDIDGIPWPVAPT